MQPLTPHLRNFNSKERYFLIGQALGNPAFKLTSDFRRLLGQAVGFVIPEEAWAAMDYHIDWLCAALTLASDEDSGTVHANAERMIRANQEDFDLIVAFDTQVVSHIVFVEAKGVTGWGNDQVASKLQRLKQIFGHDGRRWLCRTPHFVMMSPRRPTSRLDMASWPVWAKPNGQVVWLPLNVPKELVRVSRCDAQGHACKGGNRWTALPRRY